MKAIVQDQYGTAPEDVLRLAEIEGPTIGDDEILVFVRAAGVDRGPWHMMTGRPYSMRIGPGSAPAAIRYLQEGHARGKVVVSV